MISSLVQTILRSRRLKKANSSRRSNSDRVQLALELLEDRNLLSFGPLIFSDDFNQSAGSQPDHTKWGPFNATDPNNSNVVYTNSTSTLQVVNDSGALDGKALAMTLSPNPSNSSQYLSSEIMSIGQIGGALQYGHIEARIKLPGGPNGQGDGIWPAFWLIGNNLNQVGWPTCGEMDVMENKGSTPGEIQGTIHGPGYQNTGITTPYDLPGGQNFYSAYHIFGLDWSPNSVQFSVDGTVYANLTPANLPPGGVWEFNHPFNVVLDVAIGGPFAGNPTATTVYPQTMLVDYVRGYALPPALSQCTLSSASSSITTTGPTTVTLAVRDSDGDLQAPGGQQVSFAIDGGSGNGSFGNVIDNHDGTYSATFDGTLTGNVSITATVNGQPITTAPIAITVASGYAPSAYIDSYYTYIFAYNAAVAGTGSFTTYVYAYDAFVYSYYAYYYSLAVNVSSSELYAYYAYYYDYLASEYAYQDYSTSGGVNSFDAYYYGYYAWHYSYDTAIGL